MENITHLIAYFYIYSILGWIIESIFKSICQKEIVNSGFLIGPWCPIYGIGAAIMYFTLNGFRNNIIILFVVSFVILTIWEYLAGLVLETLFKVKYWDYSENKFNFQGRICLMNSIFWGILGVGFTTILHPFTSKIVEQIFVDILINVNIVLSIAFIIDLIISIIKVKDINISIDKLAEITDTLKIKMEEFKNLTGKTNEKSREKLNTLIEELKQKEENTKNIIFKQMARLKLAFPNMKSEKLTNLLKKKIDISEIRKKDKK